MENYCRFCAEPKNLAGLLYLNRDHEKCKEIYLKLLFLNAVDVLISSDVLPKTICFACYDSLNKAYDFLDKLKKAQDKFKLLTKCFLGETYEAPKIKEETLPTDQNHDGDPKFDYNDEDLTEQLVNETYDAPDAKDDASPMDQGHNDDSKFEFDDNNEEFSNETHNSPEETCTAGQNVESSIDFDVKNEEEMLNVLLYNDASLCKETINIQNTFDTPQTKYASTERKESELKLKPQKKIRTHATVEDLTCHICKKVYKNKRNLRVHRERMHTSKCKRNDYKCDHCGKVYLNKVAIVNHIKSHQHPREQIRSHICKICNNSFLYLGGLRYHVKTHPPVKSFSTEMILDYYVSLLGKTSENKFCEVNENTKSWKEFVWVCALCDVEFTDVEEFRLHCKEMHKKCSAFSCVDCKKTLKVDTFDSFVNHVRIHRKGLRNLCHYCNKTLEPDMLTTHIKEHYKNLSVCLICGELMANEETLQKHLTKYTELKLKTQRKRKYTCDHCGKKFLTKLVMRAHIMNHQKNRPPHVCKICNKSFLFPSKLRRHVKMHSAIKSFSNQDILDYYVSLFKRKSVKKVNVNKNIKSWKEFVWVCALCDAELANVDEFRSHCKTSHNKCAAFSCINCEKYLKVNTLNSFVNHVRIHWKGLRNVCHYCDKALETDILDAHVKEHSKTLFSCLTCGDLMPNEESLQQHLTKYVKVNQKLQNKCSTTPIAAEELTCHICKKVYKNKYSLRDHVRNIHTSEGVRNYTCDRCGKAFLYKGSLTTHIMVHDQVRPHVCKICNKSFVNGYKLKIHISTHSAVKPFTCEICRRNFRLHSQLKTHKIIHTDSMPYACKYCKKTFRFKQTLNNHERQHTGVKPYSCEHCFMEFTDWSNYNKHMKRKHNLDMAKKKITPEGTFLVNPKTRQIIKKDMQGLKEQKTKIMKPRKRDKKHKSS